MFIFLLKTVEKYKKRGFLGCVFLSVRKKNSHRTHGVGGDAPKKEINRREKQNDTHNFFLVAAQKENKNRVMWVLPWVLVEQFDCKEDHERSATLSELTTSLFSESASHSSHWVEEKENNDAPNAEAPPPKPPRSSSITDAGRENNERETATVRSRSLSPPPVFCDQNANETESCERDSVPKNHEETTASPPLPPQHKRQNEESRPRSPAAPSPPPPPPRSSVRVTFTGKRGGAAETFDLDRASRAVDWSVGVRVVSVEIDMGIFCSEPIRYHCTRPFVPAEYADDVLAMQVPMSLILDVSREERSLAMPSRLETLCVLSGTLADPLRVARQVLEALRLSRIDVATLDLTNVGVVPTDRFPKPACETSPRENRESETTQVEEEEVRREDDQWGWCDPESGRLICVDDDDEEENLQREYRALDDVIEMAMFDDFERDYESNEAEKPPPTPPPEPPSLSTDLPFASATSVGWGEHSDDDDDEAGDAPRQTKEKEEERGSNGAGEGDAGGHIKDDEITPWWNRSGWVPVKTEVKVVSCNVNAWHSHAYRTTLLFDTQ